MTKLIFGCGYLGERVARRWHDAGHDVVVVTRSQRTSGPVSARWIRRDRRRCHAARIARQLADAETVSVRGRLRSLGGHAGPSIEDVYAGGMRNVLAALPSSVGRFIYISTTGVYGPASGEWVDEATPPDPQRDGGRASLAAEQALAAHPLGARSVILRLAGIYGPGRVPFLDKLRAASRFRRRRAAT